MALPNHTTGSAEIYTRLSGDLVSTYASSVWRGVAPEGSLPGESEKPMVVFDVDADYSDTAFDANIARLDITVFVVRHAKGSVSDSDTVVGRVIGDGSTYGLDRWTPTITGIGENPLRLVASGEGQYDTDHAASVLRFETWISEG